MTLTFPADADVVGGLGGARGNFRAGRISSARPLSCWYRISCPASTLGILIGSRGGS